jgi:ElaB/YqjD/DUF883 family membrane-anchored ribosome-binding protein
MAEEHETTTPGPASAGDAHEFESTKAYARQAGGDRKSAAGALAEEYRGKAEQVWNDAKNRARTFREDREEYVQQNPIRVIFAVLGFGFVLGLIFRR